MQLSKLGWINLLKKTKSKSNNKIRLNQIDMSWNIGLDCVGICTVQ